jgi:hypothetical protein
MLYHCLSMIAINRLLVVDNIIGGSAKLLNE